MDRGDAAGPDAACVAAPRSQCLPSVSHGVSKRSGGARTTKSFAVSAACHVRSAERRSRYDGIVRSSQAAFQPPSQAPDYDGRRNCSRGMKRGGLRRISPSCRSYCRHTWLGIRLINMRRPKLTRPTVELFSDGEILDVNTQRRFPPP